MKINIKKHISLKWIVILTLFLVVMISFTAYAAPPTVAGQTSDVLNNFLTSLSNFLVNILRLLQKILWPIFLAIGGLLNNDLLFGAGMEERLLKIWAEIRNFVNIGFVVILLGVALYNVLGFAADNYQLKTWLPKFAIALIAVNFSFLAVKLVLDVTNVLTVAIFALPSSISDDLSYSKLVPVGVEPTLKDGKPIDGPIEEAKEKQFTGEYAKKMEKLCKNYYGDVDSFNTKIDKQKILASSLLCDVRDGSKKYVFTHKGVQFFKKYSSRNAALILAIQMMNVIDIDEVSVAAESGKINLSSITYNLLFSVILYVVYGTAYIAMFLVLLVRLVVLWILIVLSPLIALKPLIPGASDQTGELQTQFVQNAIAPIMMAIPITIGYMMLDALKQYKPSSATFKGGEALQTLSSGLNMELSGISDLQALIIAFAAVAVVWIGVFKAAEKTAAAGITGRFKDIVTQGAKTVGGLWKYIPAIPSAAGAGGKISFAAAQKAAMAPIERFKEKHGGVDQGITSHKIRSVQRGTDIGKARQVLEQGLSKSHLQRPLLNLLENWKKQRGTARGTFATKLINTLSKKDIERMRQGKLGIAQQNALKRVAGRIGPALPKTPTTPGYRRSGTAGKPTTRGTVAANENAHMIREMETNPALAAAAGSERGNLKKLLEDRRKIFKSGKPTTQIDAQIAASSSIKAMKAVYSNKPTIGNVTAAATGFKTPESVATGNTDGLKAAVTTASTALKKAGLDETERKNILGKVIGDAVGNHKNTKALLDKVL